MRLRMLAAVVAGILVFAIFAFAPIAALHLSLGLTIGPGAGALAACLVIAAFPMPRALPSTGVRQADLTPRETTSFGPRWGFILPLVSAAFLVLFLIATASLARETDYTYLSREIGLMTPGGYQTSTPYPGWFYAVPLLAVTVLLSGGVLLALRRVAGARSLGPLDLTPLDAAIRRATTRFVMLLSSSVIVLYLGATALIAGSALRNVSYWGEETPAFLHKLENLSPSQAMAIPVTSHDFINGVVEPQYTSGAIESVVGIVLIGFAIMLFILAFVAFSIRWSAAAVEQPSHERVPA